MVFLVPNEFLMVDINGEIITWAKEKDARISAIWFGVGCVSSCHAGLLSMKFGKTMHKLPTCIFPIKSVSKMAVNVFLFISGENPSFSTFSFLNSWSS